MGKRLTYSSRMAGKVLHFTGLCGSPPFAVAPLFHPVCLPGFGGSKCAACGIGTFSPGGNGTSPTPDCQRCPGYKTTPAQGSRSPNDCSIGGALTWFVGTASLPRFYRTCVQGAFPIQAHRARAPA